jgi:hypothetical protein
VEQIHPPLKLDPSLHWDDPGTEKIAYLGVPVLVGEDVLAVLRFVLITPREPSGEVKKSGFSYMDQQLAQVAAARLAPWLDREQKQRQGRALHGLTQALWRARTRQEVCRAAVEAITEAVGSCCCLVRVLDQWHDGQGQVFNVLDRLYISEEPLDLWPEVLREGEGLAGWVWQHRQEWVTPEPPREPDGTSPTSSAWEPWREHYQASAIVPLLRGDELLGTLNVHRKLRGSILRADVDLIRRVAEMVSLALHNLAQRETERTQEALLWALVAYGFGAGGAGEFPDRLLDKLAEALRNGLDPASEEAALTFAWRYSDQTQHYESPGGALPISRRAVERAFGEECSVTVTAPQEDEGLAFLLEALPEEQRLCRGCQRAALLVKRSELCRLMPATLFLLVVRPPARLSANRVQEMLRQLNDTLGRPPLA